MTPTAHQHAGPDRLLGLIKHVAGVESDYSGVVFGRPFPETLPWSNDDAEANAERYAGHADGVRETIDGAAGVRPTTGNLADSTLRGGLRIAASSNRRHGRQLARRGR